MRAMSPKSYVPVPFRAGNKIARQYVVPFDDGYGHIADITKVDYIDRKGRLIEGFTLFVKWRGK